jgi:hypothetical protein
MRVEDLIKKLEEFDKQDRVIVYIPETKSYKTFHKIIKVEKTSENEVEVTAK